MEFNLSKKQVRYKRFGKINPFYWEEDVQEFIKRLKEECKLYIKTQDIIISIDKLAGERFNGI